jgi:hypothetical protein
MELKAEMDPEEVMEDIEDTFQFIPLPEPAPSLQESGHHSEPSRWTSIQLENGQDCYHIETPFPEAGSVIEVDEDIHLKWKQHFGHFHADDEGDVIMQELEGMSNQFAPFASELDWRIASWAIKDGIGHKSFDRLMSIPGVS